MARIILSDEANIFIESLDRCVSFELLLRFVISSERDRVSTEFGTIVGVRLPEAASECVSPIVFESTSLCLSGNKVSVISVSNNC